MNYEGKEPIEERVIEKKGSKKGYEAASSSLSLEFIIIIISRQLALGSNEYSGQGCKLGPRDVVFRLLN